MTKRSVTVLGINDGHDAGAALIKDGSVLAAVQEERLNNIKHYAGTPDKSINEVFKITKSDPSEVSSIALVSYDPPGQENLNAFTTKLLLKFSPLLHSGIYIKLYSHYKKVVSCLGRNLSYRDYNSHLVKMKQEKILYT
jgi:carbamoyltransferase